MADKTSVNITYLDQRGKQGSKAITDANPNATNEQLKNFANGLNALTTNTVKSIEKIERTDITTTKPKLTLTSISVNDIVFNQQRLSELIGESTVPLKMSYSLTMTNDDGVQVPMANMFIAAVVKYTEFNQKYGVFASADLTATQGENTPNLIVVDFFFAETDTTAPTTYRLTIKYAKSTTFVQL